jgi:hypothetical protein
MSTIELTDDCMDILLKFVRSLPDGDRDEFFRAVADELRGRGRIGPSVLTQAITKVRIRKST